MKNKRYIYISKKFINDNILLNKKEIAVLVALSSYILLGVNGEKCYETGMINIDNIMAALSIPKDKNLRRRTVILKTITKLKKLSLIDFDGELNYHSFLRFKIFKSYIYVPEMQKETENFIMIDMDVFDKIVNNHDYNVSTPLIACYVSVLGKIWKMDPSIFRASNISMIGSNRSDRISKSVYTYSLDQLGSCYGVSRQTARKHVDLLIDMGLLCGVEEMEDNVRRLFVYEPENKIFVKEYMDDRMKNLGVKYKHTHEKHWIVWKRGKK